MSQTTDTPRSKSRRQGGRSTSASNGVRPSVPSPPRRRRPALTALAVLLIVGGAALAGLLAVRMDSREPVLVVNQQVDTGQQITRGMLSSVNVSGDGIDVIPAGQYQQIAGKLYARQTIYKGQLLTFDQLRKDPPLTEDQAQVGIPLTTGKYPPGLRSGDAVRLVRIGDSQTPSRALATGLVLKVNASKSGGFGGSQSSSIAEVIVPQAVADQIVGATGGDDLGIALIGRGVSIGDATITDLTDASSR